MLAETRTRGQVYADTRQGFESDWEPGNRFDAPRDELAGFSAEQAKLPATSPRDADLHLKDHQDDRPWLQAADAAAPESRTIIAAADRGGGHGHIRHEGWLTEEDTMRRAAYLEDPAQLDPGKKHRSIDGLKPGDKRHFCADLATRITDADAFATAFARGTSRPDVQSALNTPYERTGTPAAVRVPITDLLGTNGHKHCTGWQLNPVNDSIDIARDNRYEWRASRAEGRQPDVPEPKVRPVRTFERGSIVFTIGHNKERNGYEVVSMYPDPPSDDTQQHR